MSQKQLFCLGCGREIGATGCCPDHLRGKLGQETKGTNLLVRPYSLRRIYLNNGGYEYGRYGSYFGRGAPLYRAICEIDGETHEVRAGSRELAKTCVREKDRFAWFDRR